MASLEGESLWAFHKRLQEVIDVALQKSDGLQDFESALIHYRPVFLNLAVKPSKSLTDRHLINEAVRRGITVGNQKSSVKISSTLANEILQLSDALDLNEKTVLGLLFSAEKQLPRYPRYSKMQVAAVLYHEGRLSAMTALRSLIQAREGNTWSSTLNYQKAELVMKYTDQLFTDGLVERILNGLEEVDSEKETEMFQKIQSLNFPELVGQVSDLVKEQRTVLADCLFYWSCQQPFYSEQTLKLIAHLKKYSASNGIMDHVGIMLVGTLLNCFSIGDLLNWQQRDDGEPDDRYPVTSEGNFIKHCHEQIAQNGDSWAWQELGAAVKFSWAILLRECSKLTLFGGIEELEDDESLAIKCIKNGAFKFFREVFISSRTFQEEPLCSRRLHQLVTSFIVHMHLKVKELCYQAWDKENEKQLAQKGLGKKPLVLEEFLFMLGDLYMVSSSEDELNLEYWYVAEAHVQGSNKHYTTHRQLTLLRFIHMCCDILQESKQPSLFVAFIHLLKGLGNGPNSAKYCYDFLSPCGARGLAALSLQKSGGMASWEHFFSSLMLYSASLKQNVLTITTPSFSGISPEELAGLQSVLQLIRVVSDNDKSARMELVGNSKWKLLTILFELVSCAIPRVLKADIFLTLASFAKSRDIAMIIWSFLKRSGIVSSHLLTSTPKPSSVNVMSHGNQPGCIQVELEEIEAQEGDYCETRAFLELLSLLLDMLTQPSNGASCSILNEFQPYLQFCIENVFMKFDTRHYEDPTEKWLVAWNVLKVFCKLLESYQVCPEDLIINPDGAHKIRHPGITILVYMMQESKFLQKILHTLEFCVETFEQQISSNNTPLESMEQSVYLCLSLLKTTLEKQKNVLNARQGVGSGLRTFTLEPLDKLLLDISSTPKHILTVLRYVPLLQCGPELALCSVRILQSIALFPRTSKFIVDALESDQKLFQSILQGFVERLEFLCESTSVLTDQDLEGSLDSIQEDLKNEILILILNSVNLPAPNLATVLLGYQAIAFAEGKPLSQIELQNPGVMGSPYTVLHSVLAIVSNNGSIQVDCLHHQYPLQHSQKTKELAYCLVHKLCIHADLALPTLRYLRSTFNFFSDTVGNLPYYMSTAEGNTDLDDELKLLCPQIWNNNQLAICHQQAWFLKTLAVELRVTSLKKYFSHMQQLVGLLVADIDSSLPSLHTLEDGERDETAFDVPEAVTAIKSRRISVMLSQVDFSIPEFPYELELKYFNPLLVKQVCQKDSLQTTDPIRGISCINVPALRDVLLHDVNKAPQYQHAAVHAEVKRICKHYSAWNVYLQNIEARKQYFEGWRRVVQIMLCIEYGEKGSASPKLSLIMELLQDLLGKIHTNVVSIGLVTAAHEEIASLLSHLRFALEQAVYNKGIAQQILGSGSLQSIVKALSDSLSSLGSSSSLGRARIYVSLFCCFQLSKGYSKTDVNVPHDAGDTPAIPWMDYTVSDSMIEMSVSILNSYGDLLMDIICKDACSGHDITKMLALTLLNTLISLDWQGKWLQFMVHKGILNDLATSIQWEDDSLAKVLELIPQSLKALYVYESKMSLLGQISESLVGSKNLLQTNTLLHISECKFIDLRPSQDVLQGSSDMFGDTQPFGDVPSVEYSGYLPSIWERYQQLIFPVFELLRSLLNSSGTLQHEASLQVLAFIENHMDVFLLPLQEQGQNPTSVAFLQEVAFVTSILSGVAKDYQKLFNRGDNVLYPTHIGKLQACMKSLIPIYWSTENWRSISLKLGESITDDPETREKVQNMAYSLAQEVGRNLASFCRNSVLLGDLMSSLSSQIMFSPEISVQPFQSVPNSKAVLSLGLLFAHIQEYAELLDALLNDFSKENGDTEFFGTALRSEFTNKEQSEDSLSAQQKPLRISTVNCMGRSKPQILLHMYTLENLLFTLWHHLQFYLKFCKPSDFTEKVNIGNLATLHSNSQWPMAKTQENLVLSGSDTHSQLQVLKETLPDLMNQRIWKLVVAIEEGLKGNESFKKPKFIQPIVQQIQKMAVTCAVNKGL